MTDLHARISAALEKEQAKHGQVRQVGWLFPVCARCQVDWPCLPTRVVEADRRVLARHGARPVHLSTSRSQPICTYCDLTASPCPDLLNLATRADVKP